ncbi:carboxypeptidase regulatory-like domain-containing protein [Hymenobacter sp. J193]|uniref:carboxypeptidase-like regulatory domain-containing protein n=1 Tax=Hymenobacter sp. J193 TaxID=2898429 RepID=UPI002151AEB2|nr:carboxypeptidase-like regulatory domain-containing protein [Hymenobacter sp. J193]MCR5887252.1 carboxypeptidase regulatory-like domain-containing protein [Hymenobacter sp. J193]
MKTTRTTGRWWWLLALLVLLSAPRTWAQSGTDVRVTVLALPPYSTHLADYVDQPNRLVVTLTNTTRQPLQLQLAGTLTGDNGVQARTRDQVRSARPLELAALQTRRLDQDELGRLFDENQLTYSGITLQQMVRGNGLPEGTYTICVRALDYSTLRPLSAENPLGCSKSFLLRSLEPPQLVRPTPDEVVKTRSPQNILFTWTRPAGAAATTEYEVRIVELSDNRRNPNDAFLAGTTPPLFERTVPGVTTLLYGPGEPALIPGRRYAYAVTARDPQGRAAFRNNGRSEVSTFVYGETTTPPKTSPVAATTQPTKNTAKPISEVKTDLKMPAVQIRGRILWAFRKSEEGGLPFSSVPAPGVEMQGAAYAAMLDPTTGGSGSAAILGAVQAGKSGPGKANPSSPSASPNPTGAYNTTTTTTTLVSVMNGSTSGSVGADLSKTTVVSGGGQLGTVLVGNGLYDNGSGKSSKPGDIGPLQPAGSAPELKLAPLLGAARYPLSYTKVRLVYRYHRISKGKVGWDDPTLNPEREEVLGLGTTDDQGNFSIGVVSPTAFDSPVAQAPGTPAYIKWLIDGKPEEIGYLHVEVVNSRFFSEPSAYSIKTAADGGYDLGESVCLANTYRLKIKVMESATKAATGPVQVQVLRLSNWYDPKARTYARQEGQLPADNRPTVMFDNPNSATQGQGTIVTQAATADKDFTRLFPNLEGAADKYLISLKADGYSDFTTSVAVQPGIQDYEDGVVTVTKTYTLNSNPPQVRGRVVRQHDSSPVAGANIRLARTNPGSGKVYTTQTDAQGRFIITTAGTTMVPMTLEVLPGGEVGKGWKEENLKLNKTGPAGIITRDPIPVDVTMHPLVGVVNSSEGGPVAQASMRWSTGGQPWLTDEYGRFLTTHQAGADTLIISRLGFQELRKLVLVNSSTKFFALETPKEMQGAAKQLGNALDGAASLQVAGAPLFQLPGTGSVASAPENNSGSGSKPGYQVSLGSATTYAGGLVSDKDALNGYLGSIGASAKSPLGEGQDLGQFTLTKLVGRLRVTVLDSASGQPLPGTLVAFAGTEPSLEQTTGADGQTYFGKAPGGSVSLRVSGPAKGAVAYVPALQDVAVAVDGTTTLLTVRLAPGTRVQGTVRAGTLAVAGATVRVQGRPELTTQTSATGQYELVGVPKGSWTLDATKSGLVGQSQTRKFAPGTTATVDFTLTSAGFAIDKLLGFPIEVKTLTLGADTLLTGAFVNLPGNAAFGVTTGTRLEFANVPVHVGKTGLPRPKGKDFVLTDATELALTAFKYLPVLVAEPTGLKVQMQPGNPAKGQLVGAVVPNFGALGSGLGWAWKNGVKLYLSEAAGTGPVPALAVLTSDGKVPYASGLKLRAPAKSVGLDLYGFTATVDLTQSSVAADGLRLAGSVDLKSVPGLGSAAIQVPQLWIGTDGSIKTTKLGFSPPVVVSIGGFGFTLTGGGLTEQGFSLNGNVKVTVPGSEVTNISFADLAIGPQQLYGGKFALPEAGLDVFGLARFKPVKGSPLAFGKLPDGPSFFSGGAQTTLGLINKTVTIESFTVRSDGKFSAQVPADYQLDFLSMAQLNITGVKFNTIGTLGIDVLGDLRLQLPMVQAEVSNIQYRQGQAPLFTAGLHVPIGVGTLGGGISFKDNGFSGGLGLKVISVLDVQTDFSYGKVNGAVQFDAKIKTSTPPIPVGPGLALTGISGGIGFSGGALRKVSVGGVVSFVGVEAGLALNPIEVTVEPGPVVTGKASLTVLDQAVADAGLVIDFPNSVASVQLNIDYNPIPLVSTATASGKIIVSGKPNDTYWAIGLYAQASLAGLLDANANVLAGQNLNTAAHPELSEFTSFIDKNYLSGGTTVNGGHLLGTSHFGRSKDNAWSVSFLEVTGKAWLYNDGEMRLNANFKDNAYGLRVASAWGGGAELSVAGFTLGSVDIGAEYAVSGGYNKPQGWNFDGKAGAHLIASFGDCTDACETKICWEAGCADPCYYATFGWKSCEVCVIPTGAKVCVHPSLHVTYNANDGLDASLDF